MQSLVTRNDAVAVSIVIPARNEEENLGALLASLAALDFPRDRLEIIVVDHESTDRTGEIAHGAGAKVLPKKGGTIRARVTSALPVPAAPIVAFLDADCTVAEDWLKRALPYFDDPKVGAVGSYYVVPLEPSTWVRAEFCRPRPRPGRNPRKGNGFRRATC